LVIGALLVVVADGSPRCAWLVWISLVPLFEAIQALRPMQALLAGAFWGGCVGVFSILGAHAPLSPTLQALLVLTAVPAAYAAFGSWAARGLGFNPLILGLAWTPAEIILLPLDWRSKYSTV